MSLPKPISYSMSFVAQSLPDVDSKLGYSTSVLHVLFSMSLFSDIFLNLDRILGAVSADSFLAQTPATRGLVDFVTSVYLRLEGEGAQFCDGGATLPSKSAQLYKRLIDSGSPEIVRLLVCFN